MSEEDCTVDIANWLSDITSDYESENSPTTRKRKCEVDEPAFTTKRSRLHRTQSRHRPFQHQTYIRPALSEINLNVWASSEGKVRKTRSLPSAMAPLTPSSVANTPMTPTPSIKPPSQLYSRPSSNVSVPKLTDNIRNVRESIENQGIYFEDVDSYDRYPDFQQHINSIIDRERGSVMRPESLRKAKQFRLENATSNETSYFANLKPLVIKDERMVQTSKRTFEDAAKWVLKSYHSDELDVRQNVMFVKDILPKKAGTAEKEKILGLTTPQPDWVYGLKRVRFSNATPAQLGNEAAALIGIAPGLIHPFFVMENKSCEDPIEDAENQAIRSGAALVAARRRLNGIAKGPDNENDEGTTGADFHSYAFSCSWVPQMANLHVHWQEQREDGSSIYHMNLLRLYAFARAKEMSDFRHDLHNILDWGTSLTRKTAIESLVAKIVAKHSTASE